MRAGTKSVFENSVAVRRGGGIAGVDGTMVVYRRLAALRRDLTELTDLGFDRPRCTADEETRLFTMRRGALLVVVNVCRSPAALPVEETEILFETESGIDHSDGVLSSPSHAGALLR